MSDPLGEPKEWLPDVLTGSGALGVVGYILGYLDPVFQFLANTSGTWFAGALGLWRFAPAANLPMDVIRPIALGAGILFVGLKVGEFLRKAYERLQA